MKSSKRGLYVIFPLVILIWGWIIYKFFFSQKGESQKELYQTEQPESFDKESAAASFVIKANYRDPFLGKIASLDQPVKKQSSGETIKAKPILLSLSWPSISYSGIIKNQKSNKQLVLVQINGKGNMLQPGDIVDGVQLIKIYKDSIEMIFQKQKKTFRK